MRTRSLLLFICCAITATPHPMGNFSINHYARIDIAASGSTLTYVLDFAEIPTFELLQQWSLDANDPTALDTRARTEANNWLKNLLLIENRSPIAPVLKAVRVAIQDGAGGMPVLRISTVSRLPLHSGKVEYEDRNFPGRTGWKEIVIRSGKGANVISPSQRDKDLSQELTRYPLDATIAPPQKLRASFQWKLQPTLVAGSPEKPVLPTEPIKTAESAFAVLQSTAKPFSIQQPAAPGTVTKGDFLSRLLQTRQLGFGFILIGIAVAFGLGAMHALSPGHGKTIVAAYLVGSRGTIRHAMLLGSTVTLTHTLSVFLLGIGVLCFERYIIPDRIIPWLGALSGLSIVFIGALLLCRRTRALIPVRNKRAHDHANPHNHDHLHEHDHHHPHTHSHGHNHEHAHAHVYTHGGRSHSHAPPEKITLSSLIALGVSGGLVPCPSALVLMLSSIALRHAGLGLVLLTGFSCGLASVLMGIGVLVIYAKQLIPSRPMLSSHPFFRLVPVLSAAGVVCLGLGMTAISLGLLRPGRFGI